MPPRKFSRRTPNALIVSILGGKELENIPRKVREGQFQYCLQQLVLREADQFEYYQSAATERTIVVEEPKENTGGTCLTDSSGTFYPRIEGFKNIGDEVHAEDVSTTLPFKNQSTREGRHSEADKTLTLSIVSKEVDQLSLSPESFVPFEAVKDNSSSSGKLKEVDNKETDPVHFK